MTKMVTDIGMREEEETIVADSKKDGWRDGKEGGKNLL
jgi:hypothetical protein